MDCDNWIVSELSDVNVGDLRLNKRILKVASNMLVSPHETIMGASDNWADAKAAYRLFDNKRFEESSIRKCHEKATVDRLASENEVVFAIQDTMTLNYTHHPKKQGLGHLHGKFRGCYVHNSLMVSESGRALGLIDQKIFIHKESE
jgi:hypothetical protein